MSQAYHDIAWLECFINLNPFKYAFTVIQNWETEALQYFHFLLAVMVEGDESSRRFWPGTGPYLQLWAFTAGSLRPLKT